MSAVDIEALLVSHGVKPTAQRMVIAAYLAETHCHPTAEDIRKAVASQLPVAMSRATVYNTLKTLVEAGVIREVVTEAGRTRYDANMTRHHHFVDIRTGAVSDIPWQAVPKLPYRLAGKYKVKSYEITLFGEKEE